MTLRECWSMLRVLVALRLAGWAERLLGMKAPRLAGTVTTKVGLLEIHVLCDRPLDARIHREFYLSALWRAATAKDEARA